MIGPTHVQIRVLGPDDAGAFQAVRLRGLEECPSAFTSSWEEEAPTPMATIAGRLAPRADGAVFGAFSGAVLQGVVGVQRESRRKLAHKAYIWGVYVVPEARRAGVAHLLLRRALDHAAAMPGVRQVNLGVNIANRAAVALYEKLGFVAFGIERGFLLVDGVLHDECQMVWHVP